MNPLLIGFRAMATIMAAVFLFDGFTEPDEIKLEDAASWKVASHALLSGSGKTILKLEAQYGQQVKVNCLHYSALCEHVRREGSRDVQVWVSDLGHYKSPSLVKATAGPIELVSGSRQQERYAANSGWRNGLRTFFLLLAVYAWRQPILRMIGRRNAA